MVKFACQLSKVEQCVGRQVKGELGFCSDPDSRSLAEQYEGGCDDDEGTLQLLHCTVTTIVSSMVRSDYTYKVPMVYVGNYLFTSHSLCLYVGLHML